MVVENEGHWIELSRYVHLNPGRAGLAVKPEEWRWSSCPGYHLKRQQLDWIDYRPVLNEVGGANAAGRRRYRAFMEEGLGRKLDSPLASAACRRVQVAAERRRFAKVLTQLRESLSQ